MEGPCISPVPVLEWGKRERQKQMAGFLLTLDEARVLYRRYRSPLNKGKMRLPGGKYWLELGSALGQLAASPDEESRHQVLLSLSLFFLGRRVTDRLFPLPSPRNRFRPEGSCSLYHWFPAECQASIQAEGLRPGAAEKLVFMTDDPDFPSFSSCFCRKVLEAGQDMEFRPVRIDAERLSKHQEIYRTNRSYEFVARWVPPECLDFCDME